MTNPDHHFLTLPIIRDSIGETIVDLCFGSYDNAKSKLQALLIALDEDMAISECPETAELH